MVGLENYFPGGGSWVEWTSIKEEILGQKKLRKKVSAMVYRFLNKTPWETMVPFNEIGKQ